MFSPSLRRRPSLTALIPLLTSSTDPKFRESPLETHDLAYALPHPHPHLPVLLLTPSSLSPAQEPDTLRRIRRLSHLSHSPQPIITFLLPASPGASLHAFASLQILLLTLPDHPPTIPVPSAQALLAHLRTYAAALLSPPAPLPAVRAIALLPYTTASRRGRLSEHATNVVSDVCGGLRGVVGMVEGETGRVGEMIGVRDVGGSRGLREWIGEEAEGMLAFWSEERMW